MTQVLSAVMGPADDRSNHGLSVHTVTFTVTMELGIYGHQCARCAKLTPPPTAEVLAGRFRDLANGIHRLSAGPSISSEWYMPLGWTGDARRLLCETCGPIVEQAITLAMAPP